MSKQYNDSLTPDQVDAITHAWLDLSATSDMLNGDSPISRQSWQEIAVAAKDSVEELEKEFPFLMENAGEVEDE